MNGFEQFDKSMKWLTYHLIFQALLFYIGVFGCLFFSDFQLFFLLIMVGTGGLIITCAVAFRSMAKLIERDWKEEMGRKKQ